MICWTFSRLFDPHDAGSLVFDIWPRTKCAGNRGEQGTNRYSGPLTFRPHLRALEHRWVAAGLVAP
jgi:hypothetical protein